MKPLVALNRSGFIESIHMGLICISDTQNNVIANIGAPDTRIYLRSAAKPFQAIALVESGALERFGLANEELALICASHSGQDFHRMAVQRILEKIDLDESFLECGGAPPYNQQVRESLIKKGERPAPIYNCCSGKHAGMLALARFYNYPLRDYTKPHHPVQRHILEVIAQLLNCRVEDIRYGHDGCTIPTYQAAIRQGAHLFALLGNCPRENKYYQALAKIKEAILEFPAMLNGEGEFCTELIRATTGRVIGKIGAGGIYGLAVPEKNLGVMIKIADGNEKAVYPAAAHVLKELGIADEKTLDRLTPWACPPVKDHKGEVVGSTFAVFNLDHNSRKTFLGAEYIMPEDI